MNIECRSLFAAVMMPLALGACTQLAPVPGLPGASAATRGAPAAVSAAARSATLPTTFSGENEYKYQAAQAILKDNPHLTFSGKLPPMLPAIVVLRISVAENGSLSQLTVQRPPAKDDGETAVAIAAVRRTSLPQPRNLATTAGGTFTYSETFLFDAAMRFQVRTLAPVQTSD